MLASKFLVSLKLGVIEREVYIRNHRNNKAQCVGTGLVKGFKTYVAIKHFRPLQKPLQEPFF